MDYKCKCNRYIYIYIYTMYTIFLLSQVTVILRTAGMAGSDRAMVDLPIYQFANCPFL